MIFRQFETKRFFLLHFSIEQLKSRLPLIEVEHLILCSAGKKFSILTELMMRCDVLLNKEFYRRKLTFFVENSIDGNPMEIIFCCYSNLRQFSLNNC
jgi:hypothetical protein